MQQRSDDPPVKINSTNIGEQGYAPRQWAVLVIQGKATLASVPPRYQGLVADYLAHLHPNRTDDDRSIAISV
jgi:hypothetical protein